MKTNMTPCSPV